ncbi:restriction endonuclease [Candidatus Leptofilum sp.]|uniref:restriction endonuclease n=1 Tax=Candidatus Leptofilum sp. TaxID=3241576 RepID=UPI003B5B9003
MSSNLPFEIREAIISVFGKIFWYKDPFRSFLVLDCGVPSELYDRYSDESKYKIARNILSDLDRMGQEGFLIERKILTELCNLRNVPDDNVPDRNAGLDALRRLKKLASEQKLVAKKEQTESDLNLKAAHQRQAALETRAKKMEELRLKFAAMSTATSQSELQKRGYELEELLAQLFESHEIDYRRPYRVANEQIDGYFKYKGFDYLVEAKWRSSQPTESDLAALKRKVDKKLVSTRGWFLSMAGFRQQVVSEFTRGVASNIILMDGQDLFLILEGHVTLIDAIDIKIQKAAQEGIIYFPLAQRFSA